MIYDQSLSNNADDITFHVLNRSDFPLIVTWINAPHVAPWWAENRVWSLEDIEKKYSTYVEGYKLENNQRKPLYAYIIYYQCTPIGYIQYYNIYDFPGEQLADLFDLPLSLAAIDLYIGDPHFVGKGLGVQIINQFLDAIVFKKFDACFVDPACKNTVAIKAYKKAGFHTVKQIDDKVFWMIKYKH